MENNQIVEVKEGKREDNVMEWMSRQSVGIRTTSSHKWLLVWLWLV
jgi:hypothetical protein